MSNPTREAQTEFFRAQLERYKGAPQAVSSESLAHKRLRFSQIVGLFGDDNDFTVHDVGMGLADLCLFLQTDLPDKKILYSGSDIVPEFVTAARERFPEGAFYHRDVAELCLADQYDYVVMSGVFHQRRESTIRDWELFTRNLLRNAFGMCRKGIAFNFITPFVDFYQTQVYYSNLPKWLNFINDELSRFFQIRHDYPLFEYTVYVYREEHVRCRYREPEFQKYFRTDA